MSIAIFAGKVVPYKFPVLEMGLFILVLFFGSLTILHEKSNEVISGCSSWNNTSGANATAPLIPNFPSPVYVPGPNSPDIVTGTDSCCFAFHRPNTKTAM